MAKRDYYEILGVSKNATDEEIKKAYRNLAKKHHPDVSSDPKASEIFKEVNEAYEVLKDPQKRSQYDQFGHEGPKMNGGFGAGFEGFGNFGGFEDLFSSFFSGGNRTRNNSNSSKRGRDLRVNLIISFEEAAFGVDKEVSITKLDTCSNCSGTGAESKNDVETCQKCRGTGRVVGTQNTIFGKIQTEMSCPECNGTGKKIKRLCKVCNGAGRVKNTSKIKIKIPAGIDDGQTIRYQNYGEAGPNGGPNGDMLISVAVQKHEFFIREGLNIFLELPITFSQAALGAEISVPTIHGNVILKIPAGTQTGEKFRITGKGIKSERTGTQGNQYVIANIKTPTKLSNEQKELFSKLSKTDEMSDSFFAKFKKFFKF